MTGTTPPHGQHDPYSPQFHDPTGAYYTQPVQPPQQRKSRSTGVILAIVFGSIAVLCALGVVGAALAPSSKNDPPAATAGAGTPAGTPTAASATAPAATAGPLTSFGDGTHEVGTGPGQIPAGTYTAVVPDQAFDLCVWSRLAGFSGQGKDIIAVGSGNKGDKQRVTIAATDKGFDTKGCGTWTKA